MNIFLKLNFSKFSKTNAKTDFIGKWHLKSAFILCNIDHKKGPFGPLLAPPEGLRALELIEVNPGGQPQESGGDSKAI